VVALVLLALTLALRPEAGLSLIVLALPIYQLGKPLLGKVFSMVEILTILTAVAWVIHQVLYGRCCQLGIRRLVSRLSAIDWGVLALVLVGGASLLWAEHVREAAREFRTVILEAALFYGLVRTMVHDRRRVWQMADAWVLGATFIALVGILQWVLGSNLITAEGVWRVRGFYGSPNNLALYLGRVFPLALALAVWGDGERARLGRSSSVRRRGYALAAVLMAAALLLTYSRGAWLLGVPMAVLFLAAMRGRRTLFLTAGVLILASVALILAVGVGRLTSLLDTAEGTTFFRLQLWQSSWDMIRDHPLLGVGLDNFLYHYRTHYVLPTAWEEFNLSHPHNLLFDFWLRLGMPGLAVLIGLLAASFRQGRRVYRSLPEGHARLLVLGLMGGMTNFLFHGLVDNAFFLVDLSYAFMVMAALVQALHEGRGNSFQPQKVDIGRP
jgi:O-antigen ligase